MATTNNVLNILRPILWFSKVSGVFPFDFKILKSGNIKIFPRYKIKICSLIFIFILLLFYFSFIIIFVTQWALEFKIVSQTGYTLLIFTIIMSNCSLLSIFIFIWRWNKIFPCILIQINEVNKKLKVSQFCGSKIVLILLVTMQTIHLIAVSKMLFYYEILELKYILNCITSLLSTSIQISVELQFFSIIFVLVLLFCQINREIKHMLTSNTNISHRKLSQLRICYQILHDLSEVINHAYDFIIIITLCQCNAILQYGIFNILKIVFNYFNNYSSQEFDIMSLEGFLTLLLPCVRVVMILWSCINVELEVSTAKCYI
jgi:hypothetical protein